VPPTWQRLETARRGAVALKGAVDATLRVARAPCMERVAKVVCIFRSCVFYFIFLKGLGPSRGLKYYKNIQTDVDIADSKG
jgi:hypothetical protein